MYCKKRLCLDDSEMVVETMDSTAVDMADGPSSPEEVKESLELDVDTFSVRAIEDDCGLRKIRDDAVDSEFAIEFSGILSYPGWEKAGQTMILKQGFTTPG